MFLSAKAFFKQGTMDGEKLVRKAYTEIPDAFVKQYKQNVVKITPKKSGALRRSIITLVEPGSALIGWRSKYANKQNNGWSTQVKSVHGLNPRTGRYSTIRGGVSYQYRRYTTPGTGPKFAPTAFSQTQKQMPAILRERGITK